MARRGPPLAALAALALVAAGAAAARAAVPAGSWVRHATRARGPAPPVIAPRATACEKRSHANMPRERGQAGARGGAPAGRARAPFHPPLCLLSLPPAPLPYSLPPQGTPGWKPAGAGAGAPCGASDLPDCQVRCARPGGAVARDAVPRLSALRSNSRGLFLTFPLTWRRGAAWAPSTLRSGSAMEVGLKRGATWRRSQRRDPTPPHFSRPVTLLLGTRPLSGWSALIDVTLVPGPTDSGIFCPLVPPHLHAQSAMTVGSCPAGWARTSAARACRATAGTAPPLPTLRRRCRRCPVRWHASRCARTQLHRPTSSGALKVPGGSTRAPSARRSGRGTTPWRPRCFSATRPRATRRSWTTSPMAMGRTASASPSGLRIQTRLAGSSSTVRVTREQTTRLAGAS